VASLRERYAADLLRRIIPLLIIFGSVYVGSSILFYLFERGAEVPNGPSGLFLSFYWGIVTLSTLGYGDFIPTNTPARIVTMGTLFVQIFFLGYMISVITTAVSAEQQKRTLGLLGTDLKDHIVVLGYTDVGKAAVRELLAQEQKVAVVAQTPEEVPNIRSLAAEGRLYVTYGDPAEKDILMRANITLAHSVVVATGDDAQSMIAALNVRALAPNARVVVSVSRSELRDTLRAAGVTYVASPSDMGGRLCAAAAFEPDVAHALEDLSAGDVRSDIQEYQLAAESRITGKMFDEAATLARRETGCIFIGYARRQADGEYATFVDPAGDVIFRAGDAVLLVGTIENVHRFHRWFGVEQGR
jgi:voltage-gated potassium channel